MRSKFRRKLGKVCRVIDGNIDVRESKWGLLGCSPEQDRRRRTIRRGSRERKLNFFYN
jgi:hypothetical protein